MSCLESSNWGYISYIYILVCATVKGIIFKQFSLVQVETSEGFGLEKDIIYQKTGQSYLAKPYLV